jgi:hypothetical protein
MFVRPRPRLPQLPIPSQIGNNPNCSSISINTIISSDIEVHSMLLKITLFIFKLSSYLSIGGGSSEPPRRSVYYFADHKEQGESSGESSSDMSPCWKLYQQFGAVYGKRQIVSCEKEIHNGDLQSDHNFHQQRRICANMGLHAVDLNSNTADLHPHIMASRGC